MVVEEAHAQGNGHVSEWLAWVGEIQGDPWHFGDKNNEKSWAKNP